MKKLLIASYWIGIIADALATVLLFSPKIANIVLQPQPFEISEVYLYVSRIAGALMCGWTILLVWAKRKPIERAGVLILTVFVVFLLTLATIFVVRSNQIALAKMSPIFILYAVIFLVFIPSYLWARKQKL